MNEAGGQEPTGAGSTLRVVAWNCGMALHKKVEPLMALRPDLAVLSECAEPDAIRARAPHFSFSDCEWQGEHTAKGLGVVAFDGLSIRRHHSWNRAFHLFLPLEVRGSIELNLLAVWAFNRRTPRRVSPNPTTTCAALDHYADFLQARPSIVAGDFNNNVFWDKPGAPERFADVDARLRSTGLVSSYHATHGSAQGEEQHCTLFWRRNRDHSYHIDYIYVHESLLPLVSGVTVGSPEEWLALSDHMPLVLDLVLPRQAGAGSAAAVHRSRVACPAATRGE